MRRTKIRDTIEGLQEELEKTLSQLPAWEQERREHLVALNRKMTTFAVGNRIDDIQASHKDNPVVLAYLDAVERDIVDHVEIFLGIVRRRNRRSRSRARPPVRGSATATVSGAIRSMSSSTRPARPERRSSMRTTRLSPIWWG